VTAWRDVDSDRPKFGAILHKDGASLDVGKRLYRAYWGGPHRWWRSV
jgi:hypothetical protein